MARKKKEAQDLPVQPEQAAMLPSPPQELAEVSRSDAVLQAQTSSAVAEQAPTMSTPSCCICHAASAGISTV